MTIRIYLNSLFKRAKTSALLDSSATENFINPNYTRELKLPIEELAEPCKVFNVDRTQNRHGQITHYTDLEVRTGDQMLTMCFFLTNLGCYRPLGPGTSPLRSTGISAARMTRWSWMTPSSGKIGLVLLVYASPDVDGLHESPRDSAPMYVTRSPVSSCSAPCAQYSVPCTL
jgi:hypothetical protein